MAKYCIKMSIFQACFFVNLKRLPHLQSLSPAVFSSLAQSVWAEHSNLRLSKRGDLSLVSSHL